MLKFEMEGFVKPVLPQEVLELLKRVADRAEGKGTVSSLAPGVYRLVDIRPAEFGDNTYLELVFKNSAGAEFIVSASGWVKPIYDTNGANINTHKPVTHDMLGWYVEITNPVQGFRPMYDSNGNIRVFEGLGHSYFDVNYNARVVGKRVNATTAVWEA